MTAQAKPQVWMQWWAWLLAMVRLTGRVSFGALLFGAWLILAAIVVTPLAKVIFDYWAPVYEQAMKKTSTVPTAVKAKTK